MMSRACSDLAGGMQDGTAPVEGCLAISNKPRMRLPIYSAAENLPWRTSAPTEQCIGVQGYSLQHYLPWQRFESTVNAKSIGIWMNKPQCIHAMQWCRVVKREEVCEFVT
jgi:hypothetical protein